MTTTTSAVDGDGAVKGAAGGRAAVTSPPAVPQGGFMRPALLMDVAIRCTAVNCSCDCFSPCKTQIRVCDGCGHGWVSHALDKLGFRHLFHQVEVVEPGIAFDVASLVLYGTQAVPVRLKILLDRLFSVLRHDEVLQVLHGFGWTYEDYARGYILQDPSGAVLDKWLLASREEEPLILQQFLRFGETKTIAQQLLLQETSERADFAIQAPRTESDIKKFIERTSRNAVSSSFFKQHSNHIYSHIGCSVPPLPLLGSRQPSSFRHPSSSVSSRQSVSPTVSSPTNCTSPIALSPLNKLQNMQPYDFRQEKGSPELSKSDTHPVDANHNSSLSVTSPTTSVPHMSFTTTSSLNNVCNNSSTYTTASSERSGNEDGVYCSEGEDPDESDTAMNLTRSSIHTSYMDSVYAAKKVKHLRKSANPMKRRWNPNVLATLSTNPATGKKRVQCHVCLKTFCDKGALKIHFSAVHLREMHKCTVEGCNMMFSSRRSRNRHSANPNPKLHTPNYRRKINPHDGRAANPYPLMPPSGLMDYTNGMVSYSSGPHDGDSSSDSEDGHRPMSPQTNCVTPEIKRETTPFKDARVRSFLSEDGVPLPLTKRFCMEQDSENNNADNSGIDLSMKDERLPTKKFANEVKDLPEALSETPVVPFMSSSNNEETLKCEPNEVEKHNSEPKDFSQVNSQVTIKDENHTNNLESSKSNIVEKDRQTSSTKGVRKRKSQNPIKCPTASDDDLQFPSSDDSSSDTYIDQDNDENGMLDSKSDFLTSDGSDSLNDLDDMDDINSNSVKDKFHESKHSLTSLTPPKSSVVATTFQTASTKNSLEKDYHTPEKYNGFSIEDLSKFRQEMSSTHKTKENHEEMGENPLRHLESLSLGAFNNMLSMNNNRTPNFSHRGASISSGVSYHAPGLGLASVTTTTAPNRVESPEPMPNHLVNHSGVQPPPISSNCHLSNNSDTENSMSADQQMGMVPVYRDASMVGSLEIPVDKENPRRCTACGKIFQNHFGVKTHYQNVHLKLMHKCTVEGCNAAFPSKRSRDRHSANLNLHRKLLSTSSDRSAPGYFDKGAIYPFHADAYRGDLFTRLYDHNSLPLSFADIYHNRLSVDGASGSPFLTGSPFAHLPPGAMHGFHPAFLSPNLSNFDTTNSKTENHSRYQQDRHSRRNSSVSSISNPSSPSPKGSPREEESSVPSPSIKLDEELLPDDEGRFACTICEKKFHEGVVLREHYEKSHTKALLQCSMNGCNKVFLSRQSHDNHNDNLHKEKAT